MTSHESEPGVESESRYGSRFKSDSRGCVSDDVDSDHSDDHSDHDENSRQTGLNWIIESEAEKQMEFWTLKQDLAADMEAGWKKHSDPEPRSVEYTLEALEIVASESTLVAILETMKELDGLRWLAVGGRSESRMILWANSRQGESYHKSNLASRVERHKNLYELGLEVPFEVLKIADTQLRRELEVALKAVDSAGYENDLFRVSRIMLSAKEGLCRCMRTLIGSNYSVGYRLWCGNGTGSKDIESGSELCWDEPGFASALSAWLLAESEKRSKLLFERFLSDSWHFPEPVASDTIGTNGEGSEIERKEEELMR